jgi:hypothetical protein
MNSCYSKIVNNSSPKQAWRAGFREGVKMALNRGIKPTVDDFKKNHWKNMHRLYIWLMVGADAENGLWAIYGAREGLWYTMCTDWDFVNVRDFDYLNSHWETKVTPEVDPYDLLESIEGLGRNLNHNLNLPIAEQPLNVDQSRFFKTVYNNVSRTDNRIFFNSK